MKMEVRPTPLRVARAFVGEHHRHAPVTSKGALFAVSLVLEDEVVAVGIATRPISRHMQDGRTIEISRCCTLGHHNAASMVYGALCRAAKALGYKRAITYTIEGEDGVSLRAAGFVPVSETRAGQWSRTSRPRVDYDLWGNPTKPEGVKTRWEREL